jgi:S-methylmethionine-dependent homocysteine/selenocysteine methylase
MRHRDGLPQLRDELFITDGGMETTLIFHDGLDLPHFAAFVLLDDDRGVEMLRRYYEPYVEIARRHGVGIVLDTPTWRASADWGARLGYSAEQLEDVNRRAVALLEEIRATHGDVKVVVSGCVGPRGDGYRADEKMTAADAESYHTTQVATFAGTSADLVSALTMTYADEAVGIVRAAATARIPIVVSLTVETDGRLPSGQPLGEAVEEIDSATDAGAAYFMINCAHPTHFEHVLTEPGAWLDRIRAVRANASRKSHAELDESDELDSGDPDELAAGYERLRRSLTRLNVVGGCCGTDHRHVEAVCSALKG